MRLKPPRGWTPIWLMLTALTGVTGCSTAPGDRPDMKSLAAVQPHLLYLHRAPHAALYVEVDEVEGTGPSDAVLAQLREFLTLYCDKPDGITIARGATIPRAGAIGLPPSALARRYFKGPPPNGSNSPPAFIEIIYYDGRLCADPSAAPKGPPKHIRARLDTGYSKPNNPRTALRPFPGLVTVDRRYLSGWPRSLEGLILIHEAGHALGLTQNDAHGSEDHCTSENCLMRPNLKVNIWSLLLGRNPTTQTNLCEKCRADLLHGRATAPAENLRFVDGALVRSEDDYHVISLPGVMQFLVGDISQFNVAQLRAQNTSDEGTATPVSEIRVMAHISANPADAAAADADMIRLGHAVLDRDPFFRASARTILSRMQVALGQLYLSGNDGPKQLPLALLWFRKAAEAGDAEGQREFGHCLAEGLGTARNTVEAYKWLSLAADQRDRQAMAERKALAGKLTAGEIAEAGARAAAFTKSRERPEGRN